MENIIIPILQIRKLRQTSGVPCPAQEPCFYPSSPDTLHYLPSSDSPLSTPNETMPGNAPLHCQRPGVIGRQRRLSPRPLSKSQFETLPQQKSRQSKASFSAIQGRVQDPPAQKTEKRGGRMLPVCHLHCHTVGPPTPET